MSKTIKLNVLLAKTDHLASSFKKGLTEYVKFFKSNQGSFKGEKRTYESEPGTIDIPSERKNELVVTTVKEKLDYLVESSTEYIDALFSQEATNASGNAKAELIVDGISFGTFSSLELLRLKSLIENGDFESVYSNLPVRSDSEIWNKSSNEMYDKREIFETELMKGVKKTTTKESYILNDPNVNETSPTYKPTVASKDTISDLGKFTHQRFSGETTHRQRAEMLMRRTKMLTAVIESLKIANDVEAIESQMTAAKLFGYIHTGNIK